ncbi:uncharacterized protein LOC119095764 [Pollicipes pollicipes]|uniref:uncharacterized protein LOC119095764 n=1 Tax=Pollicipes pollicipes TaxID=41117 RepID=UPI0018850113|nr:uncharacterized protein LOC119095764 [Pollicipes pollicipes]
MPDASLLTITDPSQIKVQLRALPCSMTHLDFLRLLKLTVFGLNIVFTTLGALVVSAAGFGVFLLQDGGVKLLSSPDADDPGAVIVAAAATLALLALARRLRCCGVLGYTDYVSINASVPVSCSASPHLVQRSST